MIGKKKGKQNNIGGREVLFLCLMSYLLEWIVDHITYNYVMLSHLYIAIIFSFVFR